MIERLTDEQLREWRDRRDPSGQLIHDYPVIGLTDDILALRARVAQLEAALEAARPHIHGDYWVRSEAQRKIDAALKD